MNESEEKAHFKIEAYKDEYKDQVTNLINSILEDEFGRHSKSGRSDIKDIPKSYQKDSSGNFWICVKDNSDAIGTIALSNYGDGIGYLQRFMVKKEFRQKGIGKKLLSHLLNFAKSHGYKKIFLSTSDDMAEANKFYVKNGFERVLSLPEEIANQPTWDNVFYKLDLAKDNEEN